MAKVASLASFMTLEEDPNLKKHLMYAIVGMVQIHKGENLIIMSVLKTLYMRSNSLN